MNTSPNLEKLDIGHKSPALSGVFVLAALSFLLILLGGTGSESTTIQMPEIRSGSPASAGPRPQFAIADFDGDLHPDLASVQAGNTTTIGSTYWIHFRLSVAGRQSISLVGPVGGLTIEARDVNGDHAVDLVLATAWTKQPVAVFLNDGHGQFSRVAPNAFPTAFTETHDNWNVRFKERASAGVVLPQPRPGMHPSDALSSHLHLQADSMLSSRTRFSPIVFLPAHPGRAPPLPILN